jgi:pimeloyl-ACP methyl ester carboxylesterase
MRWLLLIPVIIVSALLFQNCGAPPSSLTPLSEIKEPESLDITPTLANIEPYGRVYYYLGGAKGVIVCFHGAGGSADGWTKTEKLAFLEDMRKHNYSFVCPTSLNRVDGQWANTNAADNADVINVDALLTNLQISPQQPLFLVGHSNGGGFTSRFAAYSEKKTQIKAVNLSNASGLAPLIASTSYNAPTIFNFSTCDALIDEADVLRNSTTLNSKTPSVPTILNDVTSYYAGGDPNCHEFINVSTVALSMFDSFAPTTMNFLKASFPINGDSNIKNENDGIGVDDSGNVFMAGPFSGTRSFAGLTLTSVGPQDAYVVKFDSKGQLLKSLIVSSPSILGEENIFDLVVDSKGNVYINGAFNETLQIGNFTLTKNGPAEHFLAKLDSNLNVVWAKQFGGTGYDGGNEITLADENTIVASAMSDSRDYINGIGSAPGELRDGFVLRLNAADGEVQNVYKFGGPGEQQIRAMAADSTGRMVVGFEFNGTVSFGRTSVVSLHPSPVPTNCGKDCMDGALFYFDVAGTVFWRKSVKTTSFDNFRAAGIDGEGNVYASGVHSNGARFYSNGDNPGTNTDLANVATTQLTDQFIIKYAKSGSLVWYRRLASSSEMRSQVGGELEVSEDGRAYISGGYRGKASLYNQSSILMKDVYDSAHTRDNTLIIVLGPTGYLQEFINFQGTVGSSNSIGNSASAVITTRKVEDKVYLGLGIVFEGSGALQVKTNQNTYTDTMSAVSREFSISLFTK